MAIRRKVLGEDHPDTAASYNNLALNLDAQGKYGAAEPLFQKALAIYLKVLGEDHPDTAASYNNLASNLDAQGKYGEAEPLYQKALASAGRSWARTTPTPRRATTTSPSTWMPRASTRGRAALSEGVGDPPEGPGRGPPRHRLGYNNLAANLDDQGKHGEAEPLYQKALAIR